MMNGKFKRIQLIRKNIWITKYGKKICISKLEDQHLKNIISLHEKNEPPFEDIRLNPLLIRPLLAEATRRGWTLY